MRVLITTVPACGHFFPMVALAWALRSAGHQVMVAGPRSIAKEARTAGLPSTTVGTVSPREMWMASADPTGRDNHTVAEFGISVAERTADDVLGLSEAWRPDVVLSEPMELTGPMIAALHEIPLVTHRWGLQLPEELQSALTETVHTRLTALHRRHGLVSTNCPAHVVVENCPPSLRRSESDKAVPMRYVPYCGAGIMPAWLLDKRTKPRICVSMGSLPLQAGIEGLRVTVDALAELPVEVVVAGAGSRDSSLGELPANARAGGWIPHDQLLPACDAVVHHGGAGTSMAGLDHGLPQLVLPQLGDQFANADQLVQRGAAEKLDLHERSSDRACRAVQTLLAEPSYRYRAREVRDEIATMPAPTDVATAVERIVTARGTTGRNGTPVGATTANDSAG